jgi:hypothetical protein
MLMTLCVSALILIGIVIVFYYAVFILPYMVIVSVSGGLMLWAFVCGNFTFGVMLFLSGLLVLGGGLAYIRELVDSATATHGNYFRYSENM